MTREYLYNHLTHADTLRKLQCALTVLTDEIARSDVTARVSALSRSVAEERHDIMDFSGVIDDSYVRAIFMARYVDGLTWGEIAAKLGGDNKADGVRKTCERGIAEFLEE